MSDDTGLAQVQQYLGTVDYPLSKRSLIRISQDVGVSPQLLQLIENLSKPVFDDPLDLNEELLRAK